MAYPAQAKTGIGTSLRAFIALLMALMPAPPAAIQVAASAVEELKGLPAFPGAEGAGAYSTGGRGGAVYRVTSLNARGPGSLADAVSQPNRIVVFALSGIIDLTDKRGERPKGGKLVLAQPNITLAGQSGPGPLAVSLGSGASRAPVMPARP